MHLTNFKSSQNTATLLEAVSKLRNEFARIAEARSPCVRIRFPRYRRLEGDVSPPRTSRLTSEFSLSRARA